MKEKPAFRLSLRAGAGADFRKFPHPGARVVALGARAPPAPSRGRSTTRGCPQASPPATPGSESSAKQQPGQVLRTGCGGCAVVENSAPGAELGPSLGPSKRVQPLHPFPAFRSAPTPHTRRQPPRWRTSARRPRLRPGAWRTSPTRPPRPPGGRWAQVRQPAAPRPAGAVCSGLFSGRLFGPVLDMGASLFGACYQRPAPVREFDKPPLANPRTTPPRHLASCAAGWRFAPPCSQGRRALGRQPKRPRPLPRYSLRVSTAPPPREPRARKVTFRPFRGHER